MDPFFVETITYWVNQKLNNPRNNLLDSQLNNVGEALKIQGIIIIFSITIQDMFTAIVVKSR